MVVNLEDWGTDWNRDERTKQNNNLDKIENNFTSLQNQLNNMASGGSLDELAQARVEEDGTNHDTLKQRLDIEKSETVADIGDLDLLETDDKSNLVRAINENNFDLENIESESALIFGNKYNADNTKTNTNNTQFSSILTDAYVENKTIKIPAGVYILDSTISQSFGGSDIQIIGEGKYNTILLWRGGNSSMLELLNVRNVKLSNLQISGYDFENDTDVLTEGSTAITSQGSIEAVDCYFTGFDVLFDWDGGYYHKFVDCEFRYLKTAFNQFNANNITFLNCKVMDVENFVNVNGGSGPVSFIGGSIEKVVSKAFSATSGNYAHLYLSGSYFENYPSSTPPSGITGTYSEAFVAYGFGSVTQISNTIFTNGFRRFVQGTETLKHVTSLGNRIDYSSTTSDMEYFIYKPSTIETIIANDIAYDILTQNGSYNIEYINSFNGLNNNTSMIYNPFTKEEITLPLNQWVSITFANGWSQSSTPQASPSSYRINGNVVEIKGVVDGSAATDDIIFQLPSGFYRSGESIRRVSGDVSTGDTAIIRITQTGAVLLEQGTTYPTSLIIDMEFSV
ncbi:hypothetical protein Pryu01_03065 [Paraliobacillus ryukyuensis]|uniref:Pectate lyase-like protein n=1 Tax=Paraliobacillus ryukyuensis TaxID=200904 RepID=A0A366DQC8_9BACI|nr:hypothetical protein [Paraliobacillus ryukyuensis]RBO92296.1 hypothetical protein DES48_11534 [Paraliobacillus ryukyuensis]